jgi:protein-S-isoprenylcysteine O-methyltransferase Ste14
MDTLYRRAIRETLVGSAAFFGVIFIPAGTLYYWQGWAFLATLLLPTILVTLYMAFYDKKLLESRLRLGPRVEQRPTQKLILLLGMLVYVAAIVIMVLDHRFGWSPAVPAWLSILGDALGVLGILIYFLVIRENRYAASTVQVAEGQTVISTGPYVIVRHPMYAGAILVFVGMPLALGSWWGLLFVPLFIAGFAWRLLDEEKLLATNLPGYADYMRNVRYRLIPLLW